MSKKKIIILVFVIAVIAALIIFKKTKGESSGDNKQVTLEKVELSTLIETVSATGKIQPEVEIKVSSEVSGEIIALPIKENQQVKKGDLLVKINPDIYTSGYNRTLASLSTSKAGLNQAEAQLKQAQADYNRSKTLFDKGVISKAEWDQTTASYESARASKQQAYYNVQSASATVSEARDNLGRTIIYAPADGTISLLSVELGERVLGTQQMTGTEILRVANLNNMEVEVDVNENDIVKVTIGDEAEIEVDAYLKKKFRGEVTSISNAASTALSADQVTNFKVKVRINKDSYSDLLEGKPANYSPFRPGMTATVDIITTKRENIIAVPISAIVIKEDTTSVKKDILAELEKEDQKEKGTYKPDEKFECVYINNKGKAELRVIKTGIQDDSKIEILSGLKKGEEIVTGPYTLVTKDLESGDKIQEQKE